MARMVPFPMLPTASSAERRLYERFLDDLDDSFVCYHSVDWVLAGPRGPVEGEADFVVAHPEAGVLVLEAKGGDLSYDPATRRWSQTGRDGTHHLDEDPFHQAKGEMRSLVTILEAQPGWDRWMPSYGYGVALPDAPYDEPAHPGAPAEVVLDRHDLRRLAERVPEVMAYWARPGRRFGADGMDALALALGHRVELRRPLALSFAEDDRRIVELTDEQMWIRAWLVRQGRAAVAGPAGCGKTLLAIEVAKRLAMGGARTLLTCFNKRLALHLERATEGTPNLLVRHFHRLAHEMAVEAGLEVEEQTELPDGSPYFERTLPEMLLDSAAKLGPRFDAIVVDEAQDFKGWWWPALLSTHVDPDHGRLFLFADDHQDLYGGGSMPVEPDEICPPLPDNLRNTKPIHEFVRVFHRGGAPPRSKGPDGRPVEILEYRDAEGLEHLLGVVLANLVDEEQVPVEDIVVLTPSRRSKSLLRQDGKAGRFTLSEDPAPGEVLATTIHQFKGLEAPVVILAEIGERHEDEGDALDQYLYIGGSRARVHLIVLATPSVAAQLRRRTGAIGP